MNQNKSNTYAAAEIIKSKVPGFQPQIAIVAGSGLGSFAEVLENKTTIDYEQLPGFPKLSVKGHSSKLVAGSLNGMDIAFLQGRAHSYEGIDHDSVKTYVRTMKLLGCSEFIATNASGSLRKNVGPGELVLINDHINFQPSNPLVGPNDEDFGPRFFPLDNAYDANMRQNFLQVAEKHGITLHQGVYISVLGPNYETAAEINAFRNLGADVIGMSTVPEVLVANHCGLKVAVIATITNYATGLTETSHSHESVVNTAAQAAEKSITLLRQYIQQHQ